MSSWDIAGAVVWTPLALFALAGAFTPSEPPHPRYGVREAWCLMIAVPFALGAVHSVARLCGVPA